MRLPESAKAERDLFVSGHQVWAERNPKDLKRLDIALSEGLIDPDDLNDVDVVAVYSLVSGNRASSGAEDNGLDALREKLVTLTSMDRLIKNCDEARISNCDHASRLLTDYGLDCMRKGGITIEMASDLKRFPHGNDLGSFIWKNVDQSQYNEDGRRITPENDITNESEKKASFK